MLILDITLITEVCVITEEKKSVKSDQIFTIKSLDLSDELRSEACKSITFVKQFYSITNIGQNSS